MMQLYRILDDEASLGNLNINFAFSFPSDFWHPIARASVVSLNICSRAWPATGISYWGENLYMFQPTVCYLKFQHLFPFV